MRRLDERGLAALAFVAVLVFAMSLALLWTGRGLVFTQRAAANQSRQAVAFAAAESALAWAEVQLNDDRATDESCRPAAAGATFRDRYAAPWIAGHRDADHHEAAAGYEPPPGRRVLCRIGAERLECSCPDAAFAARHAAAVETGDGPSFALELAAVAGEPRSLWVVARGCSGTWSACAIESAAAAQAQAVVRAQLRLVDADAATDPATALRRSPLAVVPGSWRDGRCGDASPLSACRFEP